MKLQNDFEEIILKVCLAKSKSINKIMYTYIEKGISLDQHFIDYMVDSFDFGEPPKTST